MSSNCIHQVALECTAGTSDKIYVIQVVETVTPAGTTYTTTGYHGRRGASLVADQKYTGSNKASAMSAALRVETEKRKKYVDHAFVRGTKIKGMPAAAPIFGVAATAAPTAAATPPVALGMLPMLATTLPSEELANMVTNRDAVFQRMYSGNRAIISLRRSAIVHTNSKGLVKPLPPEAEKELKNLLAKPDFRDGLETVIDGVLMDDVFVAIDVLTLRDNDVRPRPFDERFSDLEMLLQDNEGLLAETAHTEVEKRAMLEKAKREGWEKIVIRLGSTGYKAGLNKALMECDMTASCTCRVLSSNNATRTVQIALRNERDDEVSCGSIVVPVNQDLPEPDSLVEVQYLHLKADGTLENPVMLRPRGDIDECDVRSTLRRDQAVTAELPEVEDNVI